MALQNHKVNLREVVKKRLEKDLGKAEDIDVKSAILCGELGCGEIVQDFISRHPDLRCPYMNKVNDPRSCCERLRKEYRESITDAM